MIDVCVSQVYLAIADVYVCQVYNLAITDACNRQVYLAMIYVCVSQVHLSITDVCNS